MSITPLATRTSTNLTAQQTLARVQETQAKLQRSQEQASTGRRIDKPSDEASKVAAALVLRDRIAERDQVSENLQHGINVLNTADEALADASQILREAAAVASSQIGVGSDEETRATQANVIDAALQGLITAANRQYADLSVFGGNNCAAPEQLIFTEFLGGIRYTGGTEDLEADYGAPQSERFTANGADALGAFSTRVVSQVDLDPQANAATRLSDMRGAAFEGVRRGNINVDVNGTTVSVDLNDADKLGDVVTRVNDAINSIDPTAGSLAVGAAGLDLTANAGNIIVISDIGSGLTAADLGIDTTAASATVAGPDLHVLLTRDTQLADLGAGVNFTGGLTITQGEVTKTVNTNTAQTVEDLQNEIDRLNLGLRLEVNDDQNGLNLRSEVAGIELSVGENGGSTAADLGLRTFGLQTQLDVFRHGLGVEFSDAGDPDIQISVKDGRTFEVDLSAATDAEDVINIIRLATNAAGITVAEFDVDLAGAGNGFVFTDNTVGPNDLRIDNVGLSLAADHLGIRKNVGGVTTLEGDDVAKVRVENAFTHLADLADSLRNNDQLGITVAGGNIEDDVDNVVEARARVGVQAKRLSDQSVLNEDQKITEQSMLSELQDADLTEVLTEFQLLQTQLQASLQVGSQNLQLSLLDFLR